MATQAHRWAVLVDPRLAGVILQHTGAKSGADRETPLVYATDVDDIILIASAGGAPNHPAWYHNLIANPACHVIAKDRSGDYVAEELTGDDYDAMWTQALDVYGGYAVYQDRGATVGYRCFASAAPKTDGAAGSPSATGRRTRLTVEHAGPDPARNRRPPIRSIHIT